MSSVYFSRVFPGADLVCVEPIPENLRLLKQNLAMNAVHATVIEAAIDPIDGSVLPRDYGHKVAANTGASASATLKVEALSVPTLLQRLAWDRIGLLKVDIEGHEAILFANNCEWLSVVDVICIECHDGFGEAELQRLGDRFGFTRPRRLAGIWLMGRDGDL